MVMIHTAYIWREPDGSIHVRLPPQAAPWTEEGEKGIIEVNGHEEEMTIHIEL